MLTVAQGIRAPSQATPACSPAQPFTPTQSARQRYEAGDTRRTIRRLQPKAIQTWASSDLLRRIYDRWPLHLRDPITGALLVATTFCLQAAELCSAKAPCTLR
eukprot:TRINITY_DN11858_c0_g1_i1.p2 TRINITY_DN11858_c0_g1~~TRINITY_DN11858_c0_g1_i1.p2  ORF type:complete len:103 (-),score=1.32 TRINITY_DN11858_c0_g1_i1:3-311(-)